MENKLMIMMHPCLRLCASSYFPSFRLAILIGTFFKICLGFTASRCCRNYHCQEGSHLLMDNTISSLSSSSYHTYTSLRTATTNNNTQRFVNGTCGREYCSGCKRPSPQCLCHIFPKEKIRLETQLLILQHPAEFRRATISTVPILTSVLDNCQVLKGRSFHREVETIIDHACKERRIPLVLFPGTNAIPLDEPQNNISIHNLLLDRSANVSFSSCTPLLSTSSSITSSSSSSSSSSSPTTTTTLTAAAAALDVTETTSSASSLPKQQYLLIAVDGTWTQAKRMLRSSPVLLEKCQPVQFIGRNDTDTSIYDSIRKQPDLFCLSTLESCVRAMRLLEPNNNPNMTMASQYLLGALRAMILIQMKYEEINLEKHPKSIRNMEKLVAKKERQRMQLLLD